MSYAEDTLAWQMKAAGLPTPEREARFHPTRKWRFDFAWTDHKVAVEVEGGIWVKGRHVTGTGFEEDCRKYSTAAALGWRILRVTPHMINAGEALSLIEEALHVNHGD